MVNEISKWNSTTFVFYNTDMFHSILSFINPDLKRMDWCTYQKQFQISKLMKELVYMWMKLEIYKIHTSFRYQSFLPLLEQHQQKINKTPLFFFIRKEQCEIDIHKEERLQSFFHRYLNDLNSFQVLDEIFPHYETEIYPDTIQLISWEFQNGFKVKYKMRGKNYSGFQWITINQLDIYATIIGTPSNILKKDTFQMRMNNHDKLYDINILWNTNITGKREVFFEYGWFDPPHIHPEDI